jgi:hypothetical protein
MPSQECVSLPDRRQPLTTSPAKIIIVFFDAGGGHRSAATSLASVIEQQQRPWDVRLLNLQDYLDSLDPFLAVTRVRFQDIYNHAIKRGWTLGGPQVLPLMHGMLRMYHRPMVKRLREYWSKERPDLVISVVPNFNRTLAQSVCAGSLHSGFVTILTDLADYPPHFWMERESQYLICGSERAVEQARLMGHSPSRVFRASGMILNPRFYERPTLDVDTERRRLGLEPGTPAGLVMFGGQGAPIMLDIVKRLDQSKIDLQLIAICGHIVKLARQRRALATHKPLYVEGFTDAVSHYMSLADFFIGKPGPGSVSEALLFQLPVIVESNAWTLPQERYNAHWIVEQGVGTSVKSFKKIETAVAALLEPTAFEGYRARAAAIGNRAVFEIPDILEHILNEVLQAQVRA